tara:strand:+ start:775 stop:918 length:144 start_codon:yes stop_codon:yes gene_type:complete
MMRIKYLIIKFINQCVFEARFLFEKKSKFIFLEKLVNVRLRTVLNDK